jgi:biofilm PGA synthesis protein PgaD
MSYELSKPLIFEMPERLSYPRRLAYGSLTLIFWIGWVYLWLPLITLLGWMGGISLFREHIGVRQGWLAFLDNLPAYSLVAFMLAGTLLFWAVTNWVRFSGREARKAVSQIPLQEQANALGVDVNDLAQWQHKKRMIVHHDDDGRITIVDGQ